MILTGQANKDFISFMCKTHPNIRWHEYETMTDSMINALIIEWFDSVGIYIDTETIEYSISKANEIYNTSN